MKLAALRTDGGDKQGLMLYVFECDEAARLLSLPETPSFQSSFLVSDSVSLNCVLNTKKFYVIVPCLERENTVGRFILTATVINAMRSRSRSRTRIEKESLARTPRQTSVRLSVLPELSLTCIDFSSRKGIFCCIIMLRHIFLTILSTCCCAASVAGLHVDNEQIQLIPSSEGNVHLELHRVSSDSDNEIFSIGFAIYRGSKGTFDVRKKCLFDADLITTTMSTTSHCASVNVYLLPENFPYILIPYTSNSTNICTVRRFKKHQLFLPNPKPSIV